MPAAGPGETVSAKPQEKAAASRQDIYAGQFQLLSLSLTITLMEDKSAFFKIIPDKLGKKTIA